MNRVYVEPFDPRERWQMVVPVTFPVVGGCRRGKKALDAVPRPLVSFDHRQPEFAPLGVVHKRRKLLLLNVLAKTPMVSVLSLGHDRLANVPVFSCKRQSEPAERATGGD